MTFKIKKTAKTAGAVALSALMATSVLAAGGSAVLTADAYTGTTYDDQGNKLVFVNGGWHKESDCYLVNGEYYLKGTVGSSSTYREYEDGTVMIDGYLYYMKDCTYYGGRYYATSADPIYDYNKKNNYNYWDFVYYNGKFYLKSECYLNNGHYYPKTGATAYSSIPYYYGYDLGTYEEFENYVVINGYRFNKSDCYYDSSTKRYYPKESVYFDYYGNKYYTSYSDYLKSIGFDYWNGSYYTTKTTSVSKSDPFIYGNEKKKGWTAIINTVYSSKKGANVTIDMNDTSVISKKFLKAVEGININLKFVMKNGATWTFNGRDIDKDSIRDVNVSVKYNTNKVPAILRQKASKDQGSYSELTVGTDSAYFGFDGTLSIKFNKKNAGKTAKIYRYDSGRNVLILIDEAKINSNGTASFDLVNTGTYFITISK